MSRRAALSIVFGLALLGLWQTHPVRLFSIQSGSMQPLLAKGDAVLVQATDPLSITPGDVVSFRSQTGGKVITHRVLSADRLTGQLITQGDANPQPDEPAEIRQVIGRVAYHIPHLGGALDWLRSWQGITCAVYVPATIILLSELRRTIRYYIEPAYRLRGVGSRVTAPLPKRRHRRYDEVVTHA